MGTGSLSRDQDLPFPRIRFSARRDAGRHTPCVFGNMPDECVVNPYGISRSGSAPAKLK